MKSITLLCILFSANIFAQVGINTTTPNAQLEIKSSNQISPLNTDGILIPKIDVFPTTNPNVNQQGMMVYLTTTVGTKFPGFYFWNNATTSWNNVGSENDGWDFAGNAGTNAATHFIGTTDSQDLTFKIYNTYSGKIGAQSTSIGNQSLNPSSTGPGNSAFGIFSLYANTTGGNNTAVGYDSMFKNTTGNFNTALGHSSLKFNTSGFNNTAVGYNSLLYNSSGSGNTAIGHNSMLNNTTGVNNSALGTASLYFNTSGSNNCAFGNGSLTNNTVGMGNSAFGVENLIKNTIGNYNIGLGGYSMYENISGSNNYAIGFSAMRNNTIGNYNIAIGLQAMYQNIDGNYNTFLGSFTSTGSTGSTFSNSTALGFASTITASNQIRLGNTLVSSIGGQVGWSTLSDKRFKKEVKNNVLGLEFINKLKPVTYFVDYDAVSNFIKTPDSLRIQKNEILKLTRQTGFLAQEVEQAANELSFEFSGVDAPKNATDYYSLRYAEFVVPLVKAVQELEAKNEILEKVNKNLEERLKKIEEKLKNDR